MLKHWLLLSPDDEDGGSSTVADSSTATGDKTEKADESAKSDEVPPTSKDEKSLSDVVRETAAKTSKPSKDDKTEESDAEAEAKLEKTESGEADDSKDEKGETAEQDVSEADKKLPFNQHPRFRELIKERNEFKQMAETLKPDAERAKAITDFCTTHGITTQEFSNGMELLALLHVDPAKALAQLNEYTETLQVSLGTKLPTDLQKEVDEGTLSEARAKELAQARVRSKGFEQRSQVSEQQAAQAQMRTIATAVDAWDAQKRSADPAYVKKYALVEKTFLGLCSAQPPKTPQEAIRLAEQALTEVNKAIEGFVPKPPKRKVLSTKSSVVKADVTIDPNEDFRTALPKIARKVMAEHSAR